jgi:uncharacterized protein YhfF
VRKRDLGRLKKRKGARIERHGERLNVMLRENEKDITTAIVIEKEKGTESVIMTVIEIEIVIDEQKIVVCVTSLVETYLTRYRNQSCLRRKLSV